MTVGGEGGLEGALLFQGSFEPPLCFNFDWKNTKQGIRTKLSELCRDQMRGRMKNLNAIMKGS
jgi:hypothetical protein